MADGQQVAVREPGAALTPLEVLNNALERGAEIGSLEKLMDMQERWEKNQARKAFDKAMAAAKAELPIIRRGNAVEFSTKSGGTSTQYRYEDLATIAAAVTPILTKFGLSYRFRTASEIDAPVRVTCIVSHEMGHSEENTLTAPRDTTGSKNAIQSIGSAVTYLQRYTLKAALGIAVSNDDDGQTSGAPPVAGAGEERPPSQISSPAKVLNPETGREVNPNSSHQLRKNRAWDSLIDKMQGYVDGRDIDGLRLWFTSEAVQERIALWPQSWQEQAQEEYEKSHDEIAARERHG